MLKGFTTWITGAWKAVVAAATPIVAQLIADVLDLVTQQIPVLVTALLSALVVYLVPNRDNELA